MNEKLTAYVLNELPAEERAALEAELQNNPSLREQLEQTKTFCQLLDTHVTKTDADTFTAKQRAKLLTSFSAPPTKEGEPPTSNIVRPSFWRHPFLLSSAAVAACLAVLLVKYGEFDQAPSHRTVDFLPSGPANEKAPITLAKAEQPQPEPMVAPITSATPTPVTPPPIPGPAKPISSPAEPAIAGQLEAAKKQMAIAGRESLDPAVPAQPLDAPHPLPPGYDGNPLAHNSSEKEELSWGDIQTRDRRRPFATEGKMSNPLPSSSFDLNSPLAVNQSPRSFGTDSASDELGGSLLAESDMQSPSQLADGLNPSVRNKKRSTLAQNTPFGRSTASSDSASSMALPDNAANTVAAAALPESPPPPSAPMALPDASKNDPLAASPGTMSKPFEAPARTANQSAVLTPTPAAAGAAAPTAAPADLYATTTAPTGTSTLSRDSLVRPEPLRRRLPKQESIVSEADYDADTDPEVEQKNKLIHPTPVTRGGSENYQPIIENPFLEVTQHPLSTFSVHTDGASYANVRRFLNDGQRPPANAVRLEELINYFPYDYEPPAAGQHPFAVKVDVTEAPWQPLHRLARVAIKGFEVNQDRRPANLVFLVDVSGSMNNPLKLPLVKQSLELLTQQLRDSDRVAIVTYAGSSQIVLENTPATDKPKILAAIAALGAGGSTNGAGGIKAAYQQARAHFIKDGINRVILCSDGDFNVGVSDPKELETLIATEAKSKVFLSVLGFGTGNLNDHTMETLATKGNGNHAYIDSLGEARKVLVDQIDGTLMTIAKDVKIQIEFNPGQVASYRLLGYENRVLAKEDFNNDKKDAGEIGAGHTVTALYEIVPADLKYPNGKPVVDDLKYAPAAPAAAPARAEAAAAKASPEAMTVKLRYKQPEGDVSQLIEVPVVDAQQKFEAASPDFKFATAVAGFGMLLRNSANTGELNWELVRKLALQGKGPDSLGYRGEFIQLIEKARGLTSGQ